jgi:hypothetical protein
MPSAAGATTIIFLTELAMAAQLKTPLGTGFGSDRYQEFRAVAASCCSFREERTTRRDPDRRGTKPGRLTLMDRAETFGLARFSGHG